MKACSRRFIRGSRCCSLRAVSRSLSHYASFSFWLLSLLWWVREICRCCRNTKRCIPPQPKVPTNRLIFPLGR